MPRGHPITPEQQEYITQHKESKFIGELARDLDLDRKTIRIFLNKS